MHLKLQWRTQVLLGMLGAGCCAQAYAVEPWWDATVESRLNASGENRPEIQRFLDDVPEARRQGAAFLVTHMPERDLTNLRADFLRDNLTLAYDAWEAAPWRAQVSQELFFNDVLPYACLTESRDAWRADLHELCAPLVAECKTPGEAALVLNEKIFSLLKVRYNTARRRPDQSPPESIESGMATCTGLSILLVDACRSVGVPARVVGTPMWSNMRGNHTWVEVWDGDWHFVGAAEPDKAGLDRGWFTHEASEAQADVPRHAIYATSFRPTELAFPMVWARRDKSVSAVNVTERYAATTQRRGDVRLAVKVVDAAGKRVIADVLVTNLTTAGSPLKEKSRGETADLNNLASFPLAPGQKYRVEARLDNLSAEMDVQTTNEPEQIVTLVLGEASRDGVEVCPAPAAESSGSTSDAATGAAAE
jgi:transglutaminase-like putative cysteine protease